MTDADLARWEAGSQKALGLYGAVLDGEVVVVLALIAEIRRLRGYLVRACEAEFDCQAECDPPSAPSRPCVLRPTP